MRARVSGMVYRFVLAVSAAVIAVCLIGAWAFSRHHYAELVASAQATARVKADLIGSALEHQMIENQRDLIAKMVKTFADDPTIDRVRILDRAGEIRFSSKPSEVGNSLSAGSATCAACHSASGEPRLASAVVELGDGDLLQSAMPILNHPECHHCHSPSQRMNGVLLVDVRTGELLRAYDRDLRWMVGTIIALALGLLAAIAMSVRVVVLRRLDRFGEAARAIAAGDLQRRVPVSGDDSLAWMARSFNAMADSVTTLASELKTQRERLEMIINGVDDGIVVLDSQLKVMAANEAFLARTRRAREEMVGQPCQEVACRGVRTPSSCPSCRCFASGARQTAVLTVEDPASGERRYEEVHSSPIRVAGEVTTVVEVWRDITERRLAEGRLFQSHRMASLGMLASGFSHELNTPLGTVLTSVEGVLRALAEEKPIDGEERRYLLESARIAREQVLRCRGITQQFLRLSRGQSAPTDLIDAFPVVAAVARLVEPTARERNVSVAAPPPESPATVRASESELQQVLLNLILNAIQACRAGGQVSVELTTGCQVRIAVRDDGSGIAEDKLGRLFEPFFSLRPGGTGLGLFLSLEMARGWGADIQVKSRLGQGSQFTVVFDRASAQGGT